MRKTTEFSIVGVEAANENKLESRAEVAIKAFDRAMKNSNADVGYVATDCETVVQMGELNTIIRKNRINERLSELKAEKIQNDKKTDKGHSA